MSIGRPESSIRSVTWASMSITQQDTANSKHKSLAQTLFTTPNITLNRATSLFETYTPGGQPSAPSVNAIVCGYCKKNGHELNVCRKKIRDDGAKKRKSSSKTHTSKSSTHSKGKRTRFPCGICDDKNHRTQSPSILGAPHLISMCWTSGIAASQTHRIA